MIDIQVYAKDLVFLQLDSKTAWVFDSRNKKLGPWFHWHKIKERPFPDIWDPKGTSDGVCNYCKEKLSKQHQMLMLLQRMNTPVES